MDEDEFKQVGVDSAAILTAKDLTLYRISAKLPSIMFGNFFKKDTLPRNLMISTSFSRSSCSCALGGDDMQVDFQSLMSGFSAPVDTGDPIKSIYGIIPYMDLHADALKVSAYVFH
ncbi:MAG: hypothetical protein ACLUD2_09470 [Clostridium sp.]